MQQAMLQRCIYLGIALFWLEFCPTFLLAAEEPSPSLSPRTLAERFYKHAVKIRSSNSPSWQEQQKAVELLVAASGFRSVRHGKAFPFNGTLPCQDGIECDKQPKQQQEGEDGTEDMVLEGLKPRVSLSTGAHSGAVRELAKAFQEGGGVSQDMRLALQLFRAASDRGDPEAQGYMGMFYSMGLDQLDSWDVAGIVAFGQPKRPEALLHYYFGALGGDMSSRMALGYRHLMGLGVPQSCWTAASYYQSAAEQVSILAAGLDLSAPPTEGIKATTIKDDAVQTAGDGPASSAKDDTTIVTEASPGIAIRRQFASGLLPQVDRIRLYHQATHDVRNERQREMVQYYQFSADRGNIEAQTAVAQVLNYGTLGMDRDHEGALLYYKRAAEANDVTAMAHLGDMYANGHGTERSFEKAREWWELAARRHSGVALFGLGYLHLTGRGGVTQDFDKAFVYFTKSADQIHSEARPEAWFYLGVMHLKGYGVRRKSVQRALTYFLLASQTGHLLAQYNVAMLHLAGRGTARNCKAAMQLLKTISEKGPAAASVQLGHEHFFRGQYNLALLAYLRAADLGLELAQSNAAWILDRGLVSGINSSELAVALYQQSAAQSNVHSLLCLGDAYFYGKGVKQDWVRSAAIYYEAYQERSPEAMFNLGFMHEFGAGVPKDLKLAKKFYDMAVYTQPSASLPVVCATTWLYIHRWWDSMRPYMPSWLWSSVFALQPPHTNVMGSLLARLKGALPNVALDVGSLLWRWVVDLMGWGPLGDMVRQGDWYEGMFLLALLVLLVLVLRVRRDRAAARQRRFEAGRQLPQQPQQQLADLARGGAEAVMREGQDGGIWGDAAGSGVGSGPGLPGASPTDRKGTAASGGLGSGGIDAAEREAVDGASGSAFDGKHSTVSSSEPVAGAAAFPGSGGSASAEELG
ncbi:hypothetical protein Vafri_7607 [Volvox africanus]|uniref:Uncharacterized protein n=2 Tax=Volvox africanus TaxID=51714 RepID=A0A8J4B0L2_9CHLO|nr:hypothetical protein Vafri_7607 [Volvox africanus]